MAETTHLDIFRVNEEKANRYTAFCMVIAAGVENARYREYEMELHEGDMLFLYTDGVPEATNGQEQLYGVSRMLDALNRRKDADPKELTQIVKRDVDDFVGNGNHDRKRRPRR